MGALRRRALAPVAVAAAVGVCVLGAWVVLPGEDGSAVVAPTADIAPAKVQILLDALGEGWRHPDVSEAIAQPVPGSPVARGLPAGYAAEARLLLFRPPHAFGELGECAPGCVARTMPGGRKVLIRRTGAAGSAPAGKAAGEVRLWFPLPEGAVAVAMLWVAGGGAGGTARAQPASDWLGGWEDELLTAVTDPRVQWAIADRAVAGEVRAALGRDFEVAEAAGPEFWVRLRDDAARRTGFHAGVRWAFDVRSPGGVCDYPVPGAGPCTARTAPDGRVVQVRRMSSLLAGSEVFEEVVEVIASRPGGGSVVVELTASDRVGHAGADRRAATRTWADGYLDALVAAATAPAVQD